MKSLIDESAILNVDESAPVYRGLVRKGMLLEASELLSSSLFARVKMFGGDSREVWRSAAEGCL